MFSQRTSNQCRFMLNDAAPFIACGAVTPPGEAWCLHCREVVMAKPAPILSDEERFRRAMAFKKNALSRTVTKHADRKGSGGMRKICGWLSIPLLRGRCGPTSAGREYPSIVRQKQESQPSEHIRWKDDPEYRQSRTADRVVRKSVTKERMCEYQHSRSTSTRG
jgi:hypothetical protein